MAAVLIRRGNRGISTSLSAFRVATCEPLIGVAPWRSAQSFTTSPSGTNEEKIDLVGEKEKSSPTPSAITFPWRHSPHPLERITNRDDKSGLRQTRRARFVRKMLVANEMEVPWLSKLTGSWENDMARDFAWAFQRGLAGLLSCTFQVPMESIDQHDSGVVHIDTTSSTSEVSSQENEDTNDFVDAMLDQNLRLLYSSIDPSAIKILLKVEPISYTFEHAFLVPMLTREHVKKDPTLKGAYQAVEQEFSASGSMDKIRDMAKNLQERSGFSTMRSIIAEVSITCMEKFQVLDADTGDIIQGTENTETEVVHVVRFEMVTSKGESGGRELGSWKIIDWDDLLEGNVWH
mmetsp:Transcript_26880/g.55022  ORF Transcript_26880/g.55022 Transcript_26880/m.55022 type:complete len:347 (-) Transcript_26880:196-1236(-)|eukprot:CAMPEP_0183320990 /NCGR_PEP_ID=MMETSP0160_2-20130417/67768_1 /TAXON_ID=2839 ORGANISM="Odontella Sinensis, Strain Grunow 1884" /NCGR_SAMPLE_ID=MMETSP0160_2 /ASSEMBLY_ACC=CAM_ASM_000250 /LENGTH=346 /DNA_ID=CAMNT_0025487817 /DNA_START=79 /DNA_END=1119 /DNA_ORIENTATION=+